MSNIFSTTINENFPIAGQDNSSKGFRDNFQAIKTALTVAKVEISALENTAVITGISNDLANTVIGNATVRNFNSPIYEISNTNQNFVVYDCSIADNQRITVTDSVGIFQMTNVPSFSDTREQKFKVSFVISNLDHTITFDTTAGFDTSEIGAVDSGGSLTFDETGVFDFELITIDNGSNFKVKDLTRNNKKSHNAFELYGDGNRIGRLYKDYNFDKGFFTSTLEVDKIVANSFIGLESSDQSIDGDLSVDGNISGNYIVANIAFIGQLDSSSGTQSNITSLGTLTSLEVSGNSSLGTNGSSTVNTLFGKTDICGIFMTQISTTSSTNFNVDYTDNTIVCTAASTITPNLPMTNMSDGQRFSFAFNNSITVNFQSTEGATITGLTGISATPANGITLVYYSGRYYRI